MISQDEYEENNTEIEKRKCEINPVKGTMTLHAVITGGKENALYVRETTCARKLCFREEGFNWNSSFTWRKVFWKATEKRTSVPRIHQKNEVLRGQDDNDLKIDSDDFVVAEYDQKRYKGQVIEIHDTDDSLHVNFMEATVKAERKFKWLSRADKLWMEKEKVLHKIDNPKPTGKAGRMFVGPDEIMQCLDVTNDP